MSIMEAGFSFYTVTEAAHAIGMTDSNVRKLLSRGNIRGHKAGAIWVIPAAEVEKVKTQERPRVGRPRVSEIN